PLRGAARFDHDDRGEVARALQARSEARRHRDARRLQAEHQGRGTPEGPAEVIPALCLPLPLAGEVAARRAAGGGNLSATSSSSYAAAPPPQPSPASGGRGAAAQAAGRT